MKILAVDDHAHNIRLIGDILIEGGYEILPAYSGAEALDVLATHTPDLILLDINMPGMSGFELLAQIKTDEHLADIPVIFLTALDDIGSRLEGFGLGAEDYLVKPFNPLELIARVQARLRMKVTTDDLRDKQKVIRQTFERFVAPSVVEQLLKAPHDVKLGGQLQEVTVFFADIEGFTGISERTDPQNLLSILNRYHHLIVDIVQAHGGTIDKFMGDAVMALFNAPLQQADHVRRAVNAACDIHVALPDFHRDLPPQFRLPVNFGIHTGTAVVGHVGTVQAMDYTAVGDTVNIASRLQDAAHGGRILVSAAAYQAVRDHVNVAASGELNLRGRGQPVQTYAITCA
ncbi:MAG: adenylate/guanylate cyclase domain-containing response regulator [Anaerolineaceae bacterium]|nr:MAG: adenylate/guanylate cyclase domain-containing response regulator [Anaerolineaceae bacterium]